jgi:outer membrane biogenesis lipoprotein LolB
MLMKQWLGTELPLQAILRWLQGQDERIPGWQLLDSGNNTKVAVRASAQGQEPSVSIKLMLNEAAP